MKVVNRRVERARLVVCTHVPIADGASADEFEHCAREGIYVFIHPSSVKRASESEERVT